MPRVASCSGVRDGRRKALRKAACTKAMGADLDTRMMVDTSIVGVDRFAAWWKKKDNEREIKMRK